MLHFSPATRVIKENAGYWSTIIVCLASLVKSWKEFKRYLNLTFMNTPESLLAGWMTSQQENKMKNVHLPKISLLVQIGEEIYM